MFWEFSFNLKFKTVPMYYIGLRKQRRNWRDGLLVKSAVMSSRRPMFGSQNQPWSAQNYLKPAPEDIMTSFGCYIHMYLCAQTHTEAYLFA